MSRDTWPGRDLMRRVQDQFLELPQVKEFAVDCGEDFPLGEGRPSIRQIRAIIYPQWLWWFQECVDEREV